MKVPVLHVHVISACGLAKTSQPTFVKVFYNGAEVGESSDCAESKRPLYDDHFSVEEQLEPGPPVPLRQRGLTFEVWAKVPGSTMSTLSGSGRPRSFSSQGVKPAARKYEAADLYDDALLNRGLITKAAISSAKRRLMRVADNLTPAHVLELLGRCTVGPRILRTLWEEGNPVELRLWLRGKSWRWQQQGLLKVNVSMVRLQV
jgi:hypothetical protein